MDMDMVTVIRTTERDASTALRVVQAGGDVDVAARRPPWGRLKRTWERRERVEEGRGDGSSSRRRGIQLGTAAEHGGDVAQPTGGDVSLGEEAVEGGGVRGAHSGSRRRAGKGGAGGGAEGEDVGGGVAGEADEHVAAEGAEVVRLVRRRHEVVGVSVDVGEVGGEVGVGRGEDVAKNGSC